MEKSTDKYSTRAIRLKKSVLATLSKIAEKDCRTFVSLAEKILSDYAENNKVQQK